MKIEKGNLTIDLWEFLQEAKGEQRLELIETLSCQEDIIRHVTDQVVHGCTENGYSGGEDYKLSSDLEKSCAITRARRLIAQNTDEVSKGIIERLEKTIEEKEKELQYYRENYVHKASLAF